MKLTKSRIREPEAVADGCEADANLLRSEVVAGGGGKKCVRKWVNLGKGGCEIGKWCSFSHFETASTRLFPLVSTQVVDFPHLRMVSIFWEVVKWVATDETQIKHGFEMRMNQSKQRTNC